MKHFLILLSLLFISNWAHADYWTQIGNGTNTGSTAGPIYQSGTNATHGKVIMLYTEQELMDANIFPGDTIKELAWYKSNDALLINNAVSRAVMFQRSGGSITEYAGKYYVLDYTDTAASAGNNWQYIGTQEFDANVSNWPLEPGWMSFSITPFVYTGGSLEIFIIHNFIQDVGNVTNKSISFRRTSSTQVLYSGNASPTTTTEFSAPGYRTNINILHAHREKSVLIQDVVSPKLACPGTHPLSVEVRNTGRQPINQFVLNWSLNGVAQSPVVVSTPLDTVGGLGQQSATVTLQSNFNFTQAVSVKAWPVSIDGGAIQATSFDTFSAVVAPGLSGNYTIGGTNPNFPDFVSAVDFLNNYGICGDVNFDIRPGTYDGNSTLSKVSGSDAHKITFRSSTGNSADVQITNFQTAAGDNYVFRVSNVKNLTLKGISFVATGTSTLYTTVVELWDTTSNLTIDSCLLKARLSTSTSNGSALIYARTRGSSTLGYTEYRGENLKITNSRFEGGGSAIFIQGSNGFNETFYPDVTFENNVIDTPGAQGIYLQYVSGPQIRGNRIRLAGGGTSPTTQYGIYILNGLDGGVIERNKIYVPGANSSSANASGIFLSGVSGNNLLPFFVSNNEVTVRGTGGSSGMGGLHVNNCSYFRVFNNSVNVTGGSLTSQYAGYFSFIGSSYINNHIYNNIFANNNGGRAAYVNLTGASQYMDHNLFYTSNPGAALIQKGNSPAATLTSLAAWRAATGWDMNSISYRPPFMDSTDLRPNPADSAAWAINGRGIHSVGNGTDFSGLSRAEAKINGVPDLGAHEFTPTSTPPMALAQPATPVSGQTQVFTFGEDTVATIAWTGATVPASVVVRQYSGVVAPGLGVDSMYFYTDIQAPGAPYDYDATVYYKNPWTGSVKSEAGVRLAEQTGIDPWVIYSGAGSTVDTVRNRIVASGLSKMGIYTGIGEGCTGQPQAPLLVTPAITDPQCPGSTFRIEASDPDVASGITYQWQQAPSGAGPWTDVAAGTGNSTIFETPALNQAIYYRLKSTCVATGEFAVTNAYEIPIVPTAQVVATQDAARCGSGTVSLEATGSAGSTIYWYESATSGVVLDTGSIFNTPVLTATDTFYASASSNTRRESVPYPQADYVFSTMSKDFGLVFKANNYVTIHTVDLYPLTSSGASAAGSIKIFVRDMNNNVLDSSQLYSFTATADAVLHIVPVEIALPPGQYKLVGTVTGNIRLLSRLTNTAFPYESPSGAVSILSSTNSANGTSTDYKFFFNWQVSVPCESPRVPVIATLGAAPVLTVSSTPTVCNDGVAALTVTSPAANYDSITWTSTAGLYTDPAGTIAYTGGNAATVYARSTVPGEHQIIASGYNTLTACGNIDTTITFVQPAHVSATANPADICVNGSTVLRLDHPNSVAPGTIQWQSSPNGSSYTDIPGAVNASYATGVLNTTSYYRAVMKNSSGANCVELPLTVNVTQSEVLSTNSVIHCGPDSVTLTATGSAGSTLKWYGSISGGAILDTGSSFTTPFLSSTTTYYVAAEGGVRSNYVGKQYRTIDGTVASSGEGLNFDAYVPFVLESVAVYPVGTGSGTVTIGLLNSAGNVLDSVTVNLVGTPAPGLKTVVPLNFSVPAGSGLRLALRRRTGNVTGLIRESVPVASTEVVFPYTLAGTMSITGGTGGTIVNKIYQCFYDWKVVQACEGPRVPVTATITPAPTFTVEAVPNVLCIGDTAELSASSANTGYSYEWTPIQVTGSNVSVSPTQRTMYYVKAIDNSGGPNNGCVGYDSVAVDVRSLPTAFLSVAGNPTFCEGDSVLLFASTGAGYTYQWQRENIDIPGAVNSSLYAKEGGPHTVKVTDVNGCTAVSDPEDITVRPAPQPVIIPTGTGLSTGSFSSYQWYRDGMLIPGATSSQYTPDQEGDYTVMVSDGNNCTGISAAYHYTSTGVQHVNNRPDVRIYPNPASSTVYIITPVPVEVTLSSVDGKVVFRQKGVEQIDISNLSDAVYLVRIADLDGQVLHLSRLVKAAK